MEVEKSSEEKTYEVFETATHRYKVETEALEKLQEKGNIPLYRHIQKSLRQKADQVTGQQWEDSVNSIFEKITGQLTLVQRHFEQGKE